MTLKLDASFLIKMIEARGERMAMRTLIFDDTLLDKYDKRPVEWPSRALYRYLYIGRSPVDQCIYILLNKYVFTPSRVDFSQNYSLLMQFTTDAVQTIQAELE